MVGGELVMLMVMGKTILFLLVRIGAVMGLILGPNFLMETELGHLHLIYKEMV